LASKKPIIYDGLIRHSEIIRYVAEKILFFCKLEHPDMRKICGKKTIFDPLE
jgi:hypothetical protein